MVVTELEYEVYVVWDVCDVVWDICMWQKMYLHGNLSERIANLKKAVGRVSFWGTEAEIYAAPNILKQDVFIKNTRLK